MKEKEEQRGTVENSESYWAGHRDILSGKQIFAQQCQFEVAGIEQVKYRTKLHGKTVFFIQVCRGVDGRLGRGKQGDSGADKLCKQGLGQGVCVGEGNGNRNVFTA